jgi:GntR family transcriptional regulator / MocR family aminotransferase
MYNPQSIQWTPLFSLLTQSGLSLQGRLRLAVVRAILAGRLGSGAALPSSRQLAVLLGLGRNTVTPACLQLVDEGFLEARARSGVFVPPNARPRSAVQAEPMRGTSGQPPNWPARVMRSLVGLPTPSKSE